jgi:hypothetical protein
MNTILKHTGTPSAIEATPQRTRHVGRLLRRLVHATLDRLTLPPHDASPEYYRFPWF